MRGFCKSQVTLWKSCVHTTFEKAASSCPPTWLMLSFESSSKYPSLESGTSCPCPQTFIDSSPPCTACPFTSPQTTDSQEEEKTIQEKGTAKTKMLIYVGLFFLWNLFIIYAFVWIPYILIGRADPCLPPHCSFAAIKQLTTSRRAEPRAQYGS